MNPAIAALLLFILTIVIGMATGYALCFFDNKKLKPKPISGKYIYQTTVYHCRHSMVKSIFFGDSVGDFDLTVSMQLKLSMHDRKYNKRFWVSADALGLFPDNSRENLFAQAEAYLLTVPEYQENDRKEI